MGELRCHLMGGLGLLAVVILARKLAAAALEHLAGPARAGSVPSDLCRARVGLWPRLVAVDPDRRESNGANGKNCAVVAGVLDDAA